MSIMNILSLSKSDLMITSYYKTGPFFLRLLKSIFSPSFLCISLYRLSHLFGVLKVPLLPRIIWWVNFLFFKVDIDFRSRIYAGIYMPHPMSIVIGDGVKMNGLFKIMQGVTIGGNLGETKIVDGEVTKQPILEGNMFLGINTIIAGPLSIKGVFFFSAFSLVLDDLAGQHFYSKRLVKELSEKQINEIYR